MGQFVNLALNGETGVHEEMEKHGIMYMEEKETKPKIKPANGVKNVTRWPFISMWVISLFLFSIA